MKDSIEILDSPLKDRFIDAYGLKKSDRVFVDNGIIIMYDEGK